MTNPDGGNNPSCSFDRDRKHRRKVLAIDKEIKGIYQLRVFPKDEFCLAEHQEFDKLDQDII